MKLFMGKVLLQLSGKAKCTRWGTSFKELCQNTFKVGTDSDGRKTVTYLSERGVLTLEGTSSTQNCYHQFSERQV